MEIRLSDKEAQAIKEDMARIASLDAQAGRLMRESAKAQAEASAREAALEGFIAQKAKVEGFEPGQIERVDVDAKVIIIKEAKDGTQAGN